MNLLGSIYLLRRRKTKSRIRIAPRVRRCATTLGFDIHPHWGKIMLRHVIAASNRLSAFEMQPRWGKLMEVRFDQMNHI